MNTKLTVLILAGGSSSRFFPFNTGNHKTGLTLHGRSIISHTITGLVNKGFTNLVVVLNSADTADSDSNLKSRITTEFPEVDITFIEQPEAKGMGDAVLAAKAKLPAFFAVCFPNTTEAGALLTQMVEKTDTCCVLAQKTDKPELYGILEIENDLAVGIVEKPAPEAAPSEYKVSGLYVLNQDFLEILTGLAGAEYNFETALNTLMEKTPVAISYSDATLPSYKYPWHLFDVQELFFSQLKSYRADNAKVAVTSIIDELKGPVYLADGVIIGDSCKIIGPCYIGQDVFIGDFSLIRHSSIESGAKIGAYSEVARSIVMENTTLHYSYLGDSIIGRDVQIGAGLITANKRLDRATVKVEVKGERVDTQRPGQGVMIGPKAKLGIRVNTMPGICIGSHSTVFPAQTITKNVEHHAVIK
ncbi:MAG: sugar phosphate nucleotidyltransferase [bacterium]|nr:sugar phosphate nucleotidyltransferase [bacterium]